MRLHITRIDLWLLLVTVIWGGNFTVVKLAIHEIPPLAFNSLRLLVAAVVFLAAMPYDPTRRGGRPWPSLTRAEWVHVALLGLVGQFLYQLLFLGGLARTTVAISSLVFACTPIVVGLLSSALGHERVPLSLWLGAIVSVAGIYLVIGHDAPLGAGSALGNLMAVGAMLCWAVYSVASRPLLRHRSPLVVTGYSMAIGAALYLPFAWSTLVDMSWAAVGWGSWAGLLASALLSFCLAYMIWYTAIQRIGTTRTAMYSNVTPIIAMVIAALWLGEHLTLLKVAGAVAVLAGVAATKIDTGTPTEA